MVGCSIRTVLAMSIDNAIRARYALLQSALLTGGTKKGRFHEQNRPDGAEGGSSTTQSREP